MQQNQVPGSTAGDDCGGDSEPEGEGGAFLGQGPFSNGSSRSCCCPSLLVKDPFLLSRGLT